jgi:hypothetical protein
MRDWPGLAFLSLLLLLCACSGSKSATGDRSKDRLIDALTLFVEAVQEEQYERAFSFLTPEEKRKMMDSASPSQTKRRLKALRLSTLANKSGVRLSDGKLEGIYDQLPMIGDSPQTNREPRQEAPLLQ